MANDEENVEINRFQNQLDSLEHRFRNGGNMDQLHDSATFLLKKVGHLFNNFKDNKVETMEKKAKLYNLIERTNNLVKGIEYQIFYNNRSQPICIDMMEEINHTSVSHLHSSVSDLKDVFHKLSHIVKEQDPMFNSIESQIEQANYDSQNGREELVKTTKLISSRRRLIAKVSAALISVILVACFVF